MRLCGQRTLRPWGTDAADLPPEWLFSELLSQDRTGPTAGRQASVHVDAGEQLVRGVDAYGGGQSCCIVLRSSSVSSFVPRSAALLCVQARIAGCASSYETPAAAFRPSVWATRVR